jgi:Mo-dependent nitrogenase C-terminus
MILLSTAHLTANYAQGDRRLGGTSKPARRFTPLQPIRQWLTNIELRDRQMARVLCSAIPAQCPFARTVRLFGRTLFAVPPLCKLNPFYDELVALRFRALCYLADVCGEDISSFC